MLNKLILGWFIFAIFTTFALGQKTDDFNKFEGYAGYSNNSVQNGTFRRNSSGNFSQVRDGYNGFDISGVGNIHRYFGVKGDFSGYYNQTITIKSSIYNFMGGIQIKDNSRAGSRFRPFGHALVGVGRTGFKPEASFFTSPICAQTGIVCTNFSNSHTGFAAAIGGGIDIKITRHLSIRAIQMDYNPIHPDTNTQNNFRIGFGVVFY